jgi:hypothetical protein
MNDKENSSPSKRQYPPFYEKVVPIALVIIVVAIVLLLLVVLAVLSGLFPGAG